jgi:hypothetical protein
MFDDSGRAHVAPGYRRRAICGWLGDDDVLRRRRARRENDVEDGHHQVGINGATGHPTEHPPGRSCASGRGAVDSQTKVIGKERLSRSSTRTAWSSGRAAEALIDAVRANQLPARLAACLPPRVSQCQ